MFGIKNTIIAALLSLVIGSLGGFYFGYRYVTGDQAEEKVEALTETRQEDANAVADSQRQSEALTSSVNQIEEHEEKLKEEAASHVQKSTPIIPIAAVVLEGKGLAVPHQYESLTYGIVCVLNAARDNRAADCPAPGSDAARETVTEATFAAFVANDIAVTAEYHKLNERHNALVNYVLWLQAEQRKRLGILEESVSSDQPSDAENQAAFWEK